MRRLIFILAFVVAMPVGAQDFHWQKPLAPGKTIEIKNINGQIVAGQSDGASAEVTATRHARWSDPASVRIEAVESDAGVTVCAIYPNVGSSLLDALLRNLFSVRLEQSASTNNVCSPGAGGQSSAYNNDVSVDFAIRVPKDVRFVGRNVNGKVEAIPVDGDVEAYTVNGPVRIGSSGYAQASSVNGSIQANMGSLNKPARFQTVNGGITLELPADFKATFDASTVNGDISSDFPLTVQGSFSKRRLSGTIGGGGLQLDLMTVNGGIRLRRK